MTDRRKLIGYVRGPEGPINLYMEDLAILETYHLANEFANNNIITVSPTSNRVKTTLQYYVPVDKLFYNALAANSYKKVRSFNTDWYYLVSLTKYLMPRQVEYVASLLNKLIASNLFYSSEQLAKESLANILNEALELGCETNLFRVDHIATSYAEKVIARIKSILPCKEYKSIYYKDLLAVIHVEGVVPIEFYIDALKHIPINELRKEQTYTLLLSQKLNNKHNRKILFTYNPGLFTQAHIIINESFLDVYNSKNHIRFIKS